jgi:predicted deacetylase
VTETVQAAAQAPGLLAPPAHLPLCALCVSIHDVAPATWDNCLRLHDAIRAVADIPLTWLVVPRYHDSPLRSMPMEMALDALMDAGHELALHGYTHLDDVPPAPAMALGQRFSRGVFTQREGEFSALDEQEARKRIALGLDWFAARGWPLAGFVPPAWLLGPGAWRALSTAPAPSEHAGTAPPFLYTTTFGRFHWLHTGQSLWAPSLVYTARNRTGRLVSPRLIDLAQLAQRRAPLIRLSLHPADARHPALMRHMQRLLAHLLAAREPLTKAAFAAQYGPQNPPPRQRPGP